MNPFLVPRHLFSTFLVLIALTAFCLAAQDADPLPPEEILHVSLSFSTDDGNVIQPGGIVRVQIQQPPIPYDQLRARCLEVVKNFKSSDPVKREAAIRLVSAQFNQSPKSKYSLLAHAFRNWSARNLLGNDVSLQERDEFRTAVEDLLSARTPENAVAVGGALNTLLDLDLPIFPGDSTDTIRQRWPTTRAYKHLTRNRSLLPLPRTGYLPAWSY